MDSSTAFVSITPIFCAKADVATPVTASTATRIVVILFIRNICSSLCTVFVKKSAIPESVPSRSPLPRQHRKSAAALKKFRLFLSQGNWHSETPKNCHISSREIVFRTLSNNCSQYQKVLELIYSHTRNSQQAFETLE